MAETARDLHTGMNAPSTGFYKSKSTGEVIRTEEGRHLPPDPRSRDSTQWEYVGEQAPPEYAGRETSGELRTGMNAPRTGFYRSKSTGEVIRTEAGHHLPPDPRSRDSTEWEYAGEEAPAGYTGR